MTNEQRAIKSKIETNNQFIKMSKETIKKEKQKINLYEADIKKLQNCCLHDLEMTAFAGVAVKCKICGYVGGA